MSFYIIRQTHFQMFCFHYQIQYFLCAKNINFNSITKSFIEFHRCHYIEDDLTNDMCYVMFKSENMLLTKTTTSTSFQIIFLFASDIFRSFASKQASMGKTFLNASGFSVCNRSNICCIQ